MAHPYGVLPLDALALAGGANTVRDAGFGRLARLSDEAIMNILGNLPARDLARLGTCSKALYAFANFDDLWKGLLLEVRGPGAAAGTLGHGPWPATERMLCAHYLHRARRLVLWRHRDDPIQPAGMCTCCHLRSCTGTRWLRFCGRSTRVRLRRGPLRAAGRSRTWRPRCPATGAAASGRGAWRGSTPTCSTSPGSAPAWP